MLDIRWISPLELAWERARAALDRERAIEERTYREVVAAYAKRGSFLCWVSCERRVFVQTNGLSMCR